MNYLSVKEKIVYALVKTTPVKRYIVLTIPLKKIGGSTMLQFI